MGEPSSLTSSPHLPIVGSLCPSPFHAIVRWVCHGWLKRYLENANIPKLHLAASVPPMPSEDHKTHLNNLQIRPERLSYVFVLVGHRGDGMVVIEKHIPDNPVSVEGLAADMDEDPNIPCIGFDVIGFRARALRNIETFGIVWFGECILRTVHAVLRIIPEYRDIVANYEFVSNDITRDEDHEIFRYFTWKQTGDSRNASDGLNKFIIAYEPPWILGPRDVVFFTDRRMRNLPTFEHCEETAQQYSSTLKLWAKLWDICKTHGCHSFVLTNYNQWVFGGFSKGWENGWTMGVVQAFPKDVEDIGAESARRKWQLPRTPSLLEYLVFYTVSSMELPDSYYIPPVCIEVPYFLLRAVFSIAPTIFVYITLLCRLLSDNRSELAGCIPEETTLEMAVDGPEEIPHLQPLGQHLGNAIPPTLSASWFSSSSSSGAPSSAGVRIDNESNAGMSPPPYLNENWETLSSGAAAEKNAELVGGWFGRNIGENAPEPLPVTEIPRAPSPARSEWSAKSLATRQPFRCQGFHNLDTIIDEEVYEYDFTGMNVS
ncbi:uncharacterized protein FOMMEDRAFT_153234 [Fomitiporia mediterranea MF3/22]|uniref:uncharacterized protein n=1 Tax=Fomitiporia mediterranea (strain MF3/22) TaxID=694068 RepID=UPI00044086CD|nr:uncharacterized protein FOMMEDRAFT_153234 [Fomitiporia mediterranea MF3/22]EJD05892.1 hypothetical protein FOMMEDRAFT_153234 [Fomitiporia mediterranea MF3/22]